MTYTRNTTQIENEDSGRLLVENDHDEIFKSVLTGLSEKLGLVRSS